MKENYFMDIIESKYMGANPIKRFINKIVYKNTCKKISAKSHTLGSLWFFADFIKLAEVLYFFDNRKTGYIFSSRSYKYGNNGFVIKDENDGITLTCSLNSDTQIIEIQIDRSVGGSLSTVFTYEDGDWYFGKYDTPYNRVLVDNAIAIINRSIIHVLDYCWNKKGSFDAKI